MGAFGCLILIHIALDLVKYHDLHRLNWRKTLGETLRENLIDLTLLGVGLSFAVYFHHSAVGLSGLSGLRRAEASIARGLGTIIPKMKILHHFLKIMAHMQYYLSHTRTDLNERWSSLDRTHALLLVVSLGLLIAAPFVIPLEIETFLKILMQEIIPAYV
jgi:hypothetical protein